MLDQSIILHIHSILDELPSLQENASNHEVHFGEYEDILNQIMSLILSSELQLFSSHFAEWTFLIQKYPQFNKAGILYGMLILLKKKTATS